MAQGGDNYNDEYYVLIKTRSSQMIVQLNRIVQADAIALGLLTCKLNVFLQTSRPV